MAAHEPGDLYLSGFPPKTFSLTAKKPATLTGRGFASCHQQINSTALRFSTMVTSREIRLKSHPVGMPTADNFDLATVSVPDPAPGEVQVKNLWMTVDPYMRGRMVARAGPVQAFRVSETFQWNTKGAPSNSVMYGWRPPFQIGEVLQGGAIGEVADSSDPGFKPG